MKRAKFNPIIALLSALALCAASTAAFGGGVSSSDVANAQAAAAAASAGRDAAINALGDLVEQLQASFRAQPDYVKAAAAQAAAQAAYEPAREAVIAKLAADHAYAAAKAAYAQAEQAVAFDRAAGDDSATIIADATIAMNAGGAVTRIESAALAKDKVFQDVKAQLISSAAAMDKLQQDFHLQMLANPRYQSAQAAVNIAIAKLAAANGAEEAVASAKAEQDLQNFNQQVWNANHGQ